MTSVLKVQNKNTKSTGDRGNTEFCPTIAKLV
jgi:hypothetical protein